MNTVSLKNLWNVGCPLRSMNQRLKKPSPSSRASRKYEDYHHVHYTDAGHRAAANRHIQDRCQTRLLIGWSGLKMNLTLNFVIQSDRPALDWSGKPQSPRPVKKTWAAYSRDQIAKYKEMQDNINTSETPEAAHENELHLSLCLLSR